jgi:hypothetical protein
MSDQRTSILMIATISNCVQRMSLRVSEPACMSKCSPRVSAMVKLRGVKTSLPVRYRDVIVARTTVKLGYSFNVSLLSLSLSLSLALALSLS